MYTGSQKKLIIGDGLLASEITSQTNWNFISRKKDGIDFRIIDTYKHFFTDYDVIVNCVAYTNTYSNDKKLHYETNFKAVANLASYLKSIDKKIVHISTDYIYAGCEPFANESDLPIISKNWYTYYKLLADEFIQLVNENHLILRCSFKPKPFPYKAAWINQMGNFDYVDVISSLIVKCIEKDVNGIFNIGTEYKSMYDLALQTNSEVQKVLAPEYVPVDVSMNLDKFRGI